MAIPAPPDGPPFELGPYRVERLLGKNAAATVYAAVDSRTGRAVSLKLPAAAVLANPDAVQRLATELEAAGRLRHPNIQRLLERRLASDQSWVAAELVEGTDLETFARQGRAPLNQVFQIVMAIAQALEHAHAQGVLHRHLKPRNVLLSRDLATIKVADFGTTAIEPVRVGSGTIATSQMNLGAVRYLAPEQATVGQVDARSDLYALGVVFYELLTGRPPGARISLPSQLVPDLPSEIDEVVLRLLAQDPKRRHPSATALLADLRQLESDLKIRLMDELQGLSRTTRRLFSGVEEGRTGPPPAVWWLGGALLLAGIAVLAWLLLRGGTP
jgi:eukaryotic-like serine/threonine-protein kinase